MFYCNTCAKRKQWPESWSKSRGCCEVCGNTAICNDIPSSQLPAPFRKERILVFEEIELEEIE